MLIRFWICAGKNLEDETKAISQNTTAPRRTERR